MANIADGGRRQEASGEYRFTIDEPYYAIFRQDTITPSLARLPKVGCLGSGGRWPAW